MNTSHAPERSTGAPLSADPEDFIVGGFPDILRSLPVTDLGRLWRTLGTAADRLAVFQTCRTLRNAALRHAQKVTLRVSKGPRTKAVAVLLRLAAARTYQPVSLCIDGQQGGSEICRTIIWRSTTAGPWVAVQTLMLKNLVLFDNVAGQLGRSLPYITHLTLHKVQWGLQGLLPCIPLLACQLTHLTLAGCGMSGAGPLPTPSTSSCSPSSQSSKRGDRRSRTRMPTNTPNRSRRASGSSSSDSNNSSSNNSNRRENSSKEHGTSGLGAGAARHPPPLVHFPSVIIDLAAPSYPAADCTQPVPGEGVATSIRGSSEGEGGDWLGQAGLPLLDGTAWGLGQLHQGGAVHATPQVGLGGAAAGGSQGGPVQGAWGLEQGRWQGGPESGAWLGLGKMSAGAAEIRGAGGSERVMVGAVGAPWQQLATGAAHLSPAAGQAISGPPSMTLLGPLPLPLPLPPGSTSSFSCSPDTAQPHSAPFSPSTSQPVPPLAYLPLLTSLQQLSLMDQSPPAIVPGSSSGRKRAEQLTPLVTSRLLLGLTTLTSLRNLTLVVHDGLQLRALTCLQHLLTSLRLGGDVVESAALVPVVASCTALRHLSWRLLDQLALGPPVHLSALIAPLTALTSIDFTPDLQPGDLQQLMAQPSVTHLRLTCPASLPGLMLQRPCSWLSLAFVPHTVRGLSQALGQSSGVTNVNAAAIRWLPLHSLTQPLDVLGIQLPPSDLPADLLTASLDNLLQPGRCRVMTVPQGLFSLLQPSGGLWCAAGESSRMMSALAPLLPHVTQLVVSGVSLNAAGAVCLGAALGPRLESLTLELCQLQDSFWGVAAWVGLPHLTQLRLSNTECNAELLEVFKLALPRVVVTVRQPSRALRAAASRPVEQQWFSD